MRRGYHTLNTDEGDREEKRDDRGRYASEISSSLPLQILIYYNMLLSTVYFFFEGGLVVQKLINYWYSSELQRMLLAPVFIVWVVAELCRFYFGYAGNIQEMVPQMSAFLLMTICPQLLCLLYLTFFQEHVFPADTVVGAMEFFFLVLELVLGYYGLQAITNKRTAQFFRVAQEEFLANWQQNDGHGLHQD